MKQRAGLWLGLLLIGLSAIGGAAQEAPTATPVQINLATLIPPTAVPLLQPTATWTLPPPAAVLLEANESANVRDQPDTSAAQLGVIRAGEQYPVTGRYFLWYQFQFPTSPNGRGWVFGELVRIVGDAASIPEVDPNAVPTLPPAIVGATSTAAIVTLTPGGILTATAQAGGSSGVTTGGVPAAIGTPGILPTFTYPPGIAPLAPTPAPFNAALNPPTATPAPTPITSVIDGDVPPILPILLLGALGLLGLLVGSLRRG